MSLRRSGVSLFLGMLALNCQVSSADTKVDNTSTTSLRSFFDQVSEKAALNYFGIYRGASLGNLGNSLQPTSDGTHDSSSPQSVESLVNAGYKVNQELTIGAIAHFNYFFSTLPTGAASSNKNFQMLDPIIYAQKTNMINWGGVKLTGRLWSAFKATDTDTLGLKKLAAYVSPALIANYEVPHTSLTVGTYTYIRAYIPGSDAGDNALTYKLYVAPTANYQLTQSVAFTLWVDLIQATRYGGTGFLAGMSNPAMDIEPGISWDITKKLTINPILNFYPGTPTLAATSLQAFIIAKAF